jgi:hypothetical protein
MSLPARSVIELAMEGASDGVEEVGRLISYMGKEVVDDIARGLSLGPGRLLQKWSVSKTI